MGGVYRNGGVCIRNPVTGRHQSIHRPHPSNRRGLMAVGLAQAKYVIFRWLFKIDILMYICNPDDLLEIGFGPKNGKQISLEIAPPRQWRKQKNQKWGCFPDFLSWGNFFPILWGRALSQISLISYFGPNDQNLYSSRSSGWRMYIYIITKPRRRKKHKEYPHKESKRAPAKRFESPSYSCGGVSSPFLSRRTQIKNLKVES